MSKIKMTLEMDCSSILEFEDNLGMDGDFDIVDSLIWLLDYGGESAEGFETLHNKIKIKINKGFEKIPYKVDKENKDEQN